jgi:hypothetical protein
MERIYRKLDGLKDSVFGKLHFPTDLARTVGVNTIKYITVERVKCDG